MYNIQTIIKILESPAVLLIIGAFVGFILSILKDFFNYFIKSKKDKKALALNRLNEIFILISKYSDTAKFLPDLRFNLPIKNEFDDTEAKLGFLIRVYFPSFLPKYQSYFKAATKIVRYQQHRLKHPSAAQPTEEYKKDLEVFTREYYELYDLIVNEAKKYK